MRIIDEKGRLFGLINLIDLGVLLIIGALIVGVSLKANKMTSQHQDKVQIEVLASKVRPETAASLKVGDKMLAQNQPVPETTKILNVQVVPAQISYSVPGGGPNLVSGTDPVLKDVIVTIEGVSTSSTSDLNLHGQELKAGKKYYVKTQTVELEGLITKVNLVK